MVTVGAVLFSTVIAGLAWWLRDKQDFIPGPEFFGATPNNRARVYSVVPLLLGVHLGVPLLVHGVSGRLFCPGLTITGGWRLWLGFAQTICALSLFYGALTRLAGGLLAALWLACAHLFGFETAFENFHYLGFGAFFFLTGRGPLAMDRFLFPSLEPPARLMPKAMLVLRWAIGLTLSFVAFTEKLANPRLALEFLQQHPLNFTAALHIPMCDATFVLCCGAVELLAGLWIALGIFPRTIILIALIPFNLTLTIFDWTEMVGHLPFYGALAIFLIWTPDEENQRLWVGGVSASVAVGGAVVA